jgi:hypothetical protein
MDDVRIGRIGRYLRQRLGWRQKDLGNFDGQFEATVPPHGVVLVKLTPAK